MPTTTINGVRLAYQESGTGPPLIWVHGGFGDHHDADLIAPRLASRYRVITYDRRGHSQSERPTHQRNVVVAHTNDLAALIEQLDAAPAHLLTNSFGGELAMKVATQRPELVASLAMHEPNLFATLGEEHAPLLKELEAPVGTAMAELHRGNFETALPLFLNGVCAPGTWNELPESMRDTFIYNAPTAITDFEDPTLGTIDVEQLPRLTVPTLLTDGGCSRPWAAAVVTRLAALIPQAQRHTYPDAAHFPQITHPDEVADVITNFLNRVSVPS